MAAILSRGRWVNHESVAYYMGQCGGALLMVRHTRAMVGRMTSLTSPETGGLEIWGDSLVPEMAWESINGSERSNSNVLGVELHINGSVQDRGISSALAIHVPQSWTKPSLAFMIILLIIVYFETHQSNVS